MQRLSGILMVLAGVGLGGYTLLPASSDKAETLVEVTRIATSSDAEAIDAPASHPKHLSLPTVVLECVPAESADAPSGVRVFSPKSPLIPLDPEDAPAAASKWTAVVTTEPAGAGKLTSPKPADEDTRAHLTSDLQRELTRVGCYDGEINGSWNQSTKRAMSAFMARVNASLPVEDPDYILLTLVQGHTALACGTDCPAGEVQSSSGRCLPQAVVAQASRKWQRYEDRREAHRLAEQKKTQQHDQLAGEQRQAAAKRVADSQRLRREQVARNAAQREQAQTEQAHRLAAAASAEADAIISPSAVTQKSRQTAAAEPEVLPWLEGTDGNSQPQPRDRPVAVARPEPLPGRMAVGGPIAVRPELPAGATVTGSIDGSRTGMARDRESSDTVRRAPAPIRQAALEGLPGTKSGPAAHAQADHNYGSVIAPRLRKYPPAKIVRRSPPSSAYAPKVYGAKYAPKHKAKRYAYGSVGKTRRGQPRPGTPRYNLLQSLGGIY